MVNKESFFEHGDNLRVENWGNMNFVVIFSEDRKKSIREMLKLKGITKKKRLKHLSPHSKSRASFCVIDEKETFLWILSFNINDVQDETIVHEAFHATRYLLDYVDVKLSDDSEESFAYLIEFIYKRLKEIHNKAIKEYEIYKQPETKQLEIEF